MQAGYDRDFSDDTPPGAEPLSASTPSMNDAIGRALQSHYKDLTEEPLPYRFMVLLAELEAKEAQHDK